MNKIFKRLLSVVLAVVMVIGLVPLSRPVTVKAIDYIPAGTTIYFDPSNSPTWSQGGLYGFVSSANNTQAGLVIMEQIEGTSIYQGKLLAEATNIDFKRIDPNNPTLQGVWDEQLSWPSLVKGNYLYTLDNRNVWDGVTGSWSSYTPEDPTVPDNSLFYVNTDLVDYYNDARVDTGDTATFSTNNQGRWMGNFTEHDGTAFSYLNGKISQYLGNSDGLNLPLYFGSLLFINNRVGRTDFKSGNYTSLARWNTTANVALTRSDQNNTDVSKAEHNTTAAVQGLVYNQLGSDGQLLAADGITELPYFSKKLADEWKCGNNSLMKYYEGYQFPFKVTTYENSDVKKYSYDSESDYAVRLSEDSNEKKLVAVNTTDKTQNTDETAGYYPFNIVGESNRDNVNYGFGTKFTIPFTVNENGTINGQEDGEAITFSFTGDDDVWVFLDGHLVLDMGGAHGKAEGTIDFKNLTATVKNAATALSMASEGNEKQIVRGDSNVISNYKNSNLDNYVWEAGKNGAATQERSKVATSDSTKTFADLVDNDFAESFKDSSRTHTLVMFYMERGMYDSNMKVEFTINPLPSGLSLSKSLDVTDVNDGLASAVQEAEDDSFSFKIQTKDSESEGAFENVENLGYTLTKGNKDSELQTAQDSVISGVGAKSYAHSFINTTSEDNAFTSGTSFEITELTENTGTVFEYDYNNTTWTVYDKDANNSIIASSANSDMNNLVAKFDFPDTGDFIKYDYGVNFTNKPKVGSVSVTKQWKTGETAPTDGEYSFQILVDLDGEANNAYDYLPYELDYTLNGDTKSTDAAGKFTLKVGDTVTFAGIPVGASYKITENIPADANYTSDKEDDIVTGTIGEDSVASVTFTNSFKTEELNKVIYIEAGIEEGTNYTLKDSDGVNITITGIESVEGITAVKNDDGTVNFKSDNAGMKYEVPYSGTKTDGTIVTGTIAVFTYKATNKVYVFDYGLESDLTETNENGDGLFQGGAFYNVEAQSDDATKTTAVLDGITDDGDTPQTDVVADAAGVTINQDGTSAGKVTFKPQAFMDQAENYKYTADITKNGSVLDETNPETGTVVNGTIKVMPANTVYYEDNFNADKSGDGTIKIIYDGDVDTSSTAPTDKQSNDQSGNYGHDDAYSNDLEASGGSLTTMTNGTGAYFTFKGTGFDIISRTNAETAGIIAYVYQGEKTEFDSDDFTTSAKEDKDNPLLKTIMVDTYYSNGDLYQVPVISTEMDSHGTYTVYIRALQTYSGQTTIYIDGIRIYNPLDNNTGDYIETEKKVTVSELRDLYVKDKIEIVTYDTDGYYIVDGVTAVEQYLPDEPEIGAYVGAETVGDVINNGPNNELYLPLDNGIAFKVNKWGAEDWTLQIGAKSVSADDEADEGDEPEDPDKSITVYLKPDDASITTYAEVVKYTLNTSTDMYYDIKATDLTAAINKYNEENSTNWPLDAEYYDILILNTSDNWNFYDIISLTTLKHNGSYVDSPMARTTISGYSIQGRNVQQTDEEAILSAEFNLASVTRGKYAKMTVVTAGNVEDLKVVDPTGKEVTSFSNKTSQTDENGNKVWNLTFKVIKQKGEAVYQVSAVVDGKESGSSYPASIAIK